MQDHHGLVVSEIASSEWILLASKAIDKKSGRDTVVIDVGDVFAITEHFVITSGRTSRQVKAIVEEIEDTIKEAGGPSPTRIEGNDEYKWVLMDYAEFWSTYSTQMNVIITSWNASGVTGHSLLSLPMKQQISGEIDQKLDTVPSQGAIAQLVERFHGMEEVRGSIPLSSTET